MASTNGITLKKVTHFLDHEGCQITQADVYYQGKKLGFWSQDSWGGPDRYDFDESVLDEEVKRYAASEYVEDKYRSIVDLDILLNDLVNLLEKEKVYKKGQKKGFTTYVEADAGYRGTCGYYCCETEAEVRQSAYFKDFVSKQRKDAKISIYTGAADFNIVVGTVA